MAIDPKLYEKYSGKSGDPHARLGAALAKSAARSQKLGTRGGSATPDGAFLRKGWWWMSIIASLVIGGAVLFFLKDFKFR